jgi:predicted ferric reductase
MYYRYILASLMFVTTIPFLGILVTTDWSNKALVLFTIGNVCGLLGAAVLFWQFVLGIRFIASKITSDTIWMNQLHRKMGTYGSIFVLLHPFLQSLNTGNSLGYILSLNAQTPLEQKISLGRFAFLLFLIIFVTSALLRKHIQYRPWRYIHTLAYPLMFSVFLHARDIGTFLNTYPLLKLTWDTLTVSFVALVIYRLAKVLTIGKAKYQLVRVKQLASDVFSYELKPLGKTLIPKVGQHCYLQLKPLGEEHPFTVMEINEETGNLTFGIKALGKFTQRLTQMKPGASIWIDGPYGVFTKEALTSRDKVIIAGGIGITPFVELINRHSDANTYLLYSNKELKNAVKRDNLKAKLKNQHFDFLSQDKTSGQNILNTHLNADSIKKALNQKIIDTALFFVCGSPGFNKGVIQTLKRDLRIPTRRIYFEDLGF